MKMGTKSILFGVHQFLWHPWTVARAWRWLYGRWPTFYQWVAIFFHDIGYWGKSEMDSSEGQSHPELGAMVTWWIIFWSLRLRGRSKFYAVSVANEMADFCLYHSTHYAQILNHPVSMLYLPDKACVLVDPPWFYLFRGKLSGEVFEYTDRENEKNGTNSNITEWLYGYRQIIKGKVHKFFDQSVSQELGEGNWGEAYRVSRRKTFHNILQ